MNLYDLLLGAICTSLNSPCHIVDMDDAYAR